MNGPFSQLAKYGRGNDNRASGGMVAHISAEEAAKLKREGGAGTINPKTGLPEFFSESDPMGNAESYGYGGDTSDQSRADSDNAALSQAIAAAEIAAQTGQAPTGIPGYQTGQNQGFLTDLGYRASDKIQNMAENPFRTGIDFAAGFIPGVGLLNTISGWLGGPTIGGGITSGARALSGYDGETMTAEAKDSVRGETTGAMESDILGGDPFNTGDRGSSGSTNTPIPGVQLPPVVPETLRILDAPRPTPQPLPWQQPNYDWANYGQTNQQRFFSPFDLGTQGAPGNGSQLMRGPFG